MNGGKIFTRYEIERLHKLLEETVQVTGAEKNSIHKLKQSLSRTKPVDPQKIKSNIVTMNTVFRLKNLGNGKKETFSLVYPQDCDGSKDKLSVLSSIGAEALGSAVGTIIRSDIYNEQYYVIEDIIYQPEASGEYHP